jgi:hypothetical protein
MNCGGLGYYDVKDLVDDVNFKKYEEFCFIAALKVFNSVLIISM